MGIAVLLFSLTILVFRLRSNYYTGLLTSVFLLSFMPDSVAINLGIVIPSLTIHRLTLFILFVFWWKNRHRVSHAKTAPFMRLQVALVVGYGISTVLTLFSRDLYFLVSVKQYLDYVAGSFLLFVLFQTSLLDRLMAERVMRLLGTALILLALFGYVERYLHIAVSDLLPKSRDRYDFEAVFSASGLGRNILSTYPHRILFGIGCAVGLATLLARLNLQRLRTSTLCDWVSIVLVGGGLYFSASRTPWVAFIVATVIMSVLIARKLLKRVILLALIAVLALLLRPGAWVTVEALFADTFRPESLKGSSANWRGQIFRVALDKVTSSDPLHTVFGYGGGSRVYMTWSPIQLTTGHWAMPDSWDNDYAIVLLERGFWGFILTLALYSYAGVAMVRYVWRTKQRDTVMIFALYVLCILTVCRAMVSFSFAPQLTQIGAIALAVGSRLIQTQKAFLDASRKARPDCSSRVERCLHGCRA